MPTRHQGRTVSDTPRGCIGFFDHLVVGYHTRQQAFGKRLVSAPHAPLNQNLRGHGAPRHRDQSGEFAIGQCKAEAVDRHTQPRGRTGNAQITATR